MEQETVERQSRPDRPKWMGYAQAILILAVVGVALYFAQAPNRMERGPVSDLTRDQAKPTVSVVQPVPTEHALRVDLTGGVTLRGTVKVMSEVGGRVDWVSPSFRNGGSIAANETFIKLDPVEYELALEAATAEVARADARVLVEKTKAEESLESFARENPGADIPAWARRVPQIAQSEAELMKALAEMKRAQLRLDRTEISLPFDVRVTTADIDVGQLVGPAELVGGATSLGSVYRPDAVQVRAPVEQESLAYLAPAIGRSATIRAASGTFDAVVERTSAIIGPKSRLAALFLKFADSHPVETLPRPGSFVEVSIAGPVHDNVLVLPESAIRERGGVWVVDDGGTLQAVAPQVLGHVDDGVLVEAFDIGVGIVVGTLRGAREGLAVEVSDAPASE